MADDPGNGIGRRSQLVLVGGALGIFLLTIPFFLFLNGMLHAESPHLRPAEGYELPDSLQEAYALLLSSGRPGASEGDARQPASPVDGLTAGESGMDSVVSEAVPEAREQSPGSGEGDGAAESSTATMEAEEDPAAPTAGAELTSGDAERRARLVRLYEKMRPKQVALILGTMPERDAAVILLEMREKEAAKVLAEMDPSKAARMSQLLMRLTGNDA